MNGKTKQRKSEKEHGQSGRFDPFFIARCGTFVL